MLSLYLLLPIDLLLPLKILQGFSHHDHQCQNIEEIYHTWMQVLLLQFLSQFLNYSLHTNSSKFDKKPFSSTVSHSLQLITHLNTYRKSIKRWLPTSLSFRGATPLSGLNLQNILFQKDLQKKIKVSLKLC